MKIETPDAAFDDALDDSGSPANLVSGEKPAASSLNYMPQLDAVRAIAVFAVMLSHFGLEDLGERWQIGVWGVRQFFVLSGFLITGILLKERERSASRGGKWRVLRRFYFRRALRILPVFYFALAAATVLNLPFMREIFWWHFAYASNFYFALAGAWRGPSSHLWSLAVEEQFYLVWPWLMLLLPRRALLPAILATIAAALLYKTAGQVLHWNAITLLVSTPSCLDTLGVGALLAWSRHRAPQRFEAWARHPASGIVGVLLGVLMVAPIPYPLPVTDAIQALFFAWVVHRASIGFSGRIGRFLQMEPLLACGKISYGLYVYHNFMPFLMSWALGIAGIGAFQNAELYALLFMAATFATATLSWHVLEKPLLGLKDRFVSAV